MSDLITLTVALIFGSVMAVVILGFVLLNMRGDRRRFESQDYYQTYRQPEKRPRYSKDSSFRYGGPVSQVDLQQQRKIMIVVAAVAVVAVAVSIFFNDILEGLLIILMLPIIVRFLRARSFAKRRSDSRDEDHPSY